MQENTETVEVVNRNIGRRGTTLFTVGLTLVGAGYLFGMSPVIWAIATTPAGQNPFSEASGGGAIYYAVRSGKRSVLIVACAVSVLWLITVVVGPSFSPTHLFSF